MHLELYEYLIFHQQLQIPGIGGLRIQRQSARTDFPNRAIQPAAYSISLEPATESNAKELYSWLAAQLQIPDREAVVRFNDFAFDLKQQLSSGNSIEWPGIGKLKKNSAGSIVLAPSPVDFLFLQPARAEKVLRDKAEHLVRVGESQRTSTQMTEILSQPDLRRSSWWGYALAVGMLIIIFIGWYLSVHGVNSYALSNKKKLIPAEQPAAARTLEVQN